MVMPKLVRKQRQICKIVAGKDTTSTNSAATPGRKKRGRKKLSELKPEPAELTERAGYVCTKCGRKFNREASLRRHMEYDHRESDSEASEVDNELEDDRDRDFKPEQEPDPEEPDEQNVQVIYVASADGEEGTGSGADIDSLQQVIRAAALVEAQHTASDGTITVTLSNCPEQSSTDTTPTVIVTRTTTDKPVAPIAPKLVTDDKGETTGKTSNSKKKLTDEDRALRKYCCKVCKSRFKELPVLRAHMMTHTNKRHYVCGAEGCTYAFKTRGSLKRHMRRHTGERPFPCELCGRSFAESGALTRHLKARTPCTHKSNSDLPRYGKRWTYTPNIPAARANTVQAPEEREAEEQPVNQSANQGDVAMVTMVSDGSEVVAVEDTLQHIENVEAMEHVDEEVVDDEIVGDQVVGDHDVTADDSIQDFVHSETVIQDSQGNVCKVCCEELASTEALRVHLRTHLADEIWRCPLCHFYTESREDFQSHMNLQHDLQLKSNDQLSEGTAESATDSSPQVAAQTAVRQLLEMPTSSDDGGGAERDGRAIYACPVCNKHFSNGNYLKLHMRSHTGIRPHKCPECDKSFINRDTLNKHMSVHLEERNFKCGKCGKLFKRLSHVREHIKIHSGSRPFPCTVCEKSFKTSNAMKVHLRTHSDVMPYECTFCHRRFREKSSIVRHNRMHTGEKPFVCPHCGRRFAEHGTLNRHLKAKVSCKKPVLHVNGLGEEGTDTDYTMLTEFSSVVADTQQYIVPGSEEAGHGDIQESVTEYVVAYEEQEDVKPGEEIQNVQIISDETQMDSVEVTGDYQAITDEEAGLIHILDTKTGEVMAVVPLSGDGTENQVQSITMSQDGQVSMVTLLSTEEGQANEEDEMEVVDGAGSDELVVDTLGQSTGPASDEVNNLMEIAGEGVQVLQIVSEEEEVMLPLGGEGQQLEVVDDQETMDGNNVKQQKGSNINSPGWRKAKHKLKILASDDAQ
ncbi:transcription factor E4F1-like isoform X2 [Mya arenaria]|nr:transcription factor E4F1-like isoform X2 [Mya arenaria]